MHVYRPEHSIIQAPSDVLEWTVLNLIDFWGKGGRCYNKLEFEGGVLLILKSPPMRVRFLLGTKGKTRYIYPIIYCVAVGWPQTDRLSIDVL